MKVSKTQVDEMLKAAELDHKKERELLANRYINVKKYYNKLFYFII